MEHDNIEEELHSKQSETHSGGAAQLIAVAAGAVASTALVAKYVDVKHQRDFLQSRNDFLEEQCESYRKFYEEANAALKAINSSLNAPIAFYDPARKRYGYSHYFDVTLETPYSQFQWWRKYFSVVSLYYLFGMRRLTDNLILREIQRLANSFHSTGSLVKLDNMHLMVYEFNKQGQRVNHPFPDETGDNGRALMHVIIDRILRDTKQEKSVVMLYENKHGREHVYQLQTAMLNTPNLLASYWKWADLMKHNSKERKWIIDYVYDAKVLPLRTLLPPYMHETLDYIESIPNIDNIVYFNSNAVDFDVFGWMALEKIDMSKHVAKIKELVQRTYPK